MSMLELASPTALSNLNIWPEDGFFGPPARLELAISFTWLGHIILYQRDYQQETLI